MYYGFVLLVDLQTLVVTPCFKYEFHFENFRFLVGHDVVEGSPRHAIQHKLHVTLKGTTMWQSDCHDVVTNDIQALNF